MKPVVIRSIEGSASRSTLAILEALGVTRCSPREFGPMLSGGKADNMGCILHYCVEGVNVDWNTVSSINNSSEVKFITPLRHPHLTYISRWDRTGSDNIRVESTANRIKHSWQALMSEGSIANRIFVVPGENIQQIADHIEAEMVEIPDPVVIGRLNPLRKEWEDTGKVEQFDLSFLDFAVDFYYKTLDSCRV
jgi:hypothetical protein